VGQQVARAIGFLGVPAAVLLAAAWTLPHLPGLQKAYAVLVPYLPYGVLGVGLALSWQFNRSRVFFGLLGLLLAYWGMQQGLTEARSWGLASSAVIEAIGFVLPLSVVAVWQLSERGIFTWHGGVRLLALVLPIAVAVLAASPKINVPHWLPAEFWRPHQLPFSSLPIAVVGAFAAAASLQLASLAWRPAPLDAALVGALIAVAMAFDEYPRLMTAATYMSAAGLLLIVGVVQDGYRKAYVDELTGLPGRRALEEELLKLSGQYTMAMVDVDHFKKFNDTYGHEVGDQVLRMVASQLSRVTGGGRPFRYGGEEFSLLFNGTDTVGTVAHLDSLRERIAETPFAIRGRRRRGKNARAKNPRPGTGRRTNVTVSIGLAERSVHHNTPSDVLKAADQALYRAKRGGRNRVSD
jgi:diguanylate cyclase (GGDEF)-like protein